MVVSLIIVPEFALEVIEHTAQVVLVSGHPCVIIGMVFDVLEGPSVTTNRDIAI